jgi:hypothetical protein
MTTMDGTCQFLVTLGRGPVAACRLAGPVPAPHDAAGFVLLPPSRAQTARCRTPPRFPVDNQALP